MGSRQPVTLIGGGPLGPDDLRVSVNAAYAPFTAALAEGDEIAFIPPVSGG